MGLGTISRTGQTVIDPSHGQLLRHFVSVGSDT